MSVHLKNYAKSIGLYLIFINLGLVLALIFLSAIGFLPYSDRPGPGWHGSHFSLRESWFFLTWGFSFTPYTLFYGTGIYFLSQLMRFLRIPYFVRTVLSGLISGFISMYLVAGAGWIIAISGPPVYISGFFGLTYGAWLLPKYLGKELRGISFSKREKVGVPISLGLLGVLVYFTFFYRSYSQDYTINVISPSDSTLDLSADDFLLENEKSVLLEKNLNRNYDVVYQSLFSQGGNSEKSRVLIVIQKKTGNNATLPQPRNANVVFIEEAGKWKMYPKDAQVLKKKIHLKQLDNDSNQWTIKIEPKEESIFQWEPSGNSPIRKANGRAKNRGGVYK